MWEINAAAAVICAVMAVMPRMPMWYRVLALMFTLMNLALI